MKKIFSIILALLAAFVCLSGFSAAVFAEGEESGDIVITKDPVGEIVTEGEDALFVTRAYGYSGLIWELVSPDGETVLRSEEALKAFPGLDMAGYESEELTLITIPYSLNGWQVRTRFFDAENDWALSDTAEITVIRGDVPAPEVKPLEAGARLTPGEQTTLRVEATSPGGDTLKYQWYRSTSAARNSGEPVLGATQADFTPPEEIGQLFYYVGVWCVNGRMASAPVYTPPVAIIYSETRHTPEPTAEAADEENEIPAQNAEAELPPPADTPDETDRMEERSGMPTGGKALLTAVAAMAVLALLAVSATLLILRALSRRRSGEDESGTDGETPEGEARGETNETP